MSRPLACHHRCRCGAELSCGDPDRCPIGSREWLCEACELDEADLAINRLIPQSPEPTQLDLTRMMTHEKH